MLRWASVNTIARECMKHGKAYKMGELLFGIGLDARRKFEGYDDGRGKTLAKLKQRPIYGSAQFAAWLAVGEYVVKNFQPKKTSRRRA